MRKKIYWSLGTGLVGVLLAQKGAYGLPGTYLEDLGTFALGAIGGAIAGLLIGCIVEQTKDERKRQLKVLYWLLVMAILGSYLGIGRHVQIGTTFAVMMCTLGIGLLAGLLQYFMQSGKTMR
jgi:hypothetical protein